MTGLQRKTGADAKKIFNFPRTFESIAQFMKSRSACFVLLVGLTLILTSCGTPRKIRPPSELLVLISIDGFRWDYLQKYDAPTLRKFAADGVHARRMTPSFPSLTFPNHYTLVTGLRPEHHGIVGNTFHDPTLNAKFAYKSHESSVDSRWWESGEPIWITAEKQGMRSACFFWPGSEAEIQGKKATFVKPFDKSLSCNERVDGLLGWLRLPPEQRPRLATLYFNVIDDVGHREGPDGAGLTEAVKEVDAALARLLDGLESISLRDRTNFVIVSDHGMESTSPDRTILLDDYAPLSSYEVDFAGPNAALWPKSGTAEELVEKFRGKHPQMNAWLRSEVPDRLHYRASDRIAPVILSANPGWFITSHDYLRVKRATFDRGSHGYDPSAVSMGALFIASGPDFKRRVEIDDVENIHIYNLLCAVLGLKPALNDGDTRLVRQAFPR
jgi:predicted AlkP superfamily pyrophosphatase or phosphodiesterase